MRNTLGFLSASVAALLLSCGPPQLPTKVKPPGSGEDSKYQCKEVTGSTNPWLVEWDPTAKVRLQSKAKKGVLLVKYSGCNLEVLYGCEVDGRYEFTATTRSSQTEYINNESELFAKLPIGALNLAAEFNQGDRWSLDYVVVGTQDATVNRIERADLSGRCAEATHFVQGMAVGAYQLGAQAHRKGGAEATLYGVGTGGSRGSAAGNLRQDGRYEKCVIEETDATDRGCQAIVQLYLEPVSGAGPPPDSSGPAGPSNETWNPDATSESWAPEDGWVSISSNLKGLAIEVDGTDVGKKTPVSRLKVRAGRHEISVIHKCTYPAREIVNVEKGGEHKVKIETRLREGSIRVMAVGADEKPAPVDVYVDGKKLGRTDGSWKPNIYKVSICAKKLELKGGDKGSYSASLKVKEKKNTDVKAQLKGGVAGRGGGGDSTGKAGVKWIYSKPAGVKFTRSEITVDQYRACVKAGSCSSKGVTMTYWGGEEQPKYAKYCNYEKGDRGNHPMNCIDWRQAKAVCSWLGGRLPTEDEWYAEASNGGSRDWPWGDSPGVNCDYAIWGDGSKTDGCGKNRTWPVCSKTKGNSVSGLCDMSGNLWEWTSDLYDSEHDWRVVRGGSWYVDSTDLLRASYRFRLVPTTRSHGFGVRCVRVSH